MYIENVAQFHCGCARTLESKCIRISPTDGSQPRVSEANTQYLFWDLPAFLTQMPPIAPLSNICSVPLLCQSEMGIFKVGNLSHKYLPAAIGLQVTSSFIFPDGQKNYRDSLKVLYGLRELSYFSCLASLRGTVWVVSSKTYKSFTSTLYFFGTGLDS